MNWKQIGAGAGAALGVAALGGILGGRRGFEAGAIIGAIGATGYSAISSNGNYPTATAAAATTGLATAVLAWGSTPRGKRGFASAMETAKSFAR
jgi:hypothetical protein